MSRCSYPFQRKTPEQWCVFAVSAAAAAPVVGRSTALPFEHGTRGGDGCGRSATHQHGQGLRWDDTLNRRSMPFSGPRFASLELNDLRLWMSMCQNLWSWPDGLEGPCGGLCAMRRLPTLRMKFMHEKIGIELPSFYKTSNASRALSTKHCTNGFVRARLS